MSQRIPDRLDPWRYADLGKTVEGTISLGSMPRLSQCLRDSQGEAQFDLRFERDRERRATLCGRITAELALECQRCLDVVTLPIEIDVALAFVEVIEQASRLPETLDPCLVEEGRVLFRDLIEDELLLMLPQVPMHESGACSSSHSGKIDEPPVEPDNSTSENPFAVLAELKRDKD
jgi:uncharacterized protein